MAGCSDMMTIEGTVQTGSPDPVCLPHRVWIAATNGHLYEVEPSYIGLYLERFEGHHIIARVRPFKTGKNSSVIRISSLKVLEKTPPDARPDPLKTCLMGG